MKLIWKILAGIAGIILGGLLFIVGGQKVSKHKRDKKVKAVLNQEPKTEVKKDKEVKQVTIEEAEALLNKFDKEIKECKRKERKNKRNKRG